MLSSLPITAVPLLILLPAWGCGAEPGTDKVLAHFDFEEAGWSAHSVLSGHITAKISDILAPEL